MDAQDAFELIRSAIISRRQRVPTSFEPITVPIGTTLRPIPSWLAKRRGRKQDLAGLLGPDIVAEASAAMFIDAERMTDCVLELETRHRKRGLNRLNREMKKASMSPIEWLRDARAALKVVERPSKGSHRIYAILLGGFGSNMDEYGVYVGETSYLPDVRFVQHLTDADPETGVIPATGMRMSSRFVRRRGIELLPSLVSHLDGFSPTDAEALECEVAEILKKVGIRVRGGH